MATNVKPDGEFVVIYAGPYTGINVQQPANLIKDTDATSITDFVLRNSEIRSRPSFNPTFISAPAAGDLILMVGVFNNIIFAYNNVGNFYTYDAPSATWTERGSVAATLYNVEWRIFNNILYFTGDNSGYLSSWDGTTFTMNVATTTDGGETTYSLGAWFLDELSQQVLLANTLEQNGGTTTQFGTRLRWSAVGLPAVWDASVNQNAGFNNFIDVPDGITGLMMLGRVGYVLRTNGITEIDPTGIGTAPFQFNHLWASQFGVGNVSFYVSAQYGLTGVIIASDNIYSIQSYQLNPIGGMTRDAIMSDLGHAASYTSSGSIPVGCLLPYFGSGLFPSGLLPEIGSGLTYVYLTYMLFIPMLINGVYSTKVWVYSFEDNNWTSFILPNYQVTAKPSLGLTYTGTHPYANASYHMLIPVVNTTTNVVSIGTFDPSSFNDPNEGSSITFKAEDIVPNMYPTVRRVILVYTDIGQATVTCTVTGTNDLGQVVSANKTVTIGNTVPTGALLTTFVDLTLAAFRPQLTVARAAGAGPIAISHIEMIGHVERVAL